MTTRTDNNFDVNEINSAIIEAAKPIVQEAFDFIERRAEAGPVLAEHEKEGPLGDLPYIWHVAKRHGARHAEDLDPAHHSVGGLSVDRIVAMYLPTTVAHLAIWRIVDYTGGTLFKRACEEWPKLFDIGEHGEIVSREGLDALRQVFA